MAKRKMSVSFSNSIIDVDNMTITEIKKDDMNTFNLIDVLSHFANIDGVSLTISTDETLSENSNGG